MKSCCLKIMLFFSLFICDTESNFGQNPNTSSISESVLPKVFQLDKHEMQVEEMLPDYDYLTTVCNNDMDKAFSNWLNLLGEIEKLAETQDFDLTGLKAWVRVFFDKNGNIEHFGYYLKHDSKGFNTTRLSQFFEELVNEYKFPISNERKFLHYTTVNFPVFVEN